MRPRRPLQIASLAVTLVLGLALGGMYGLLVSTALWVAFRVYMRMRPWPPAR